MKLLYIEQDNDLREVVSLALGLDRMIEVQAFASGASALQALDEGDWRPNCLLLDSMTPRRGGMATLAEIRRRPDLARTPVAFTSGGHGPTASVTDPYLLAVIEKPFDAMTLAANLRRLFLPHWPWESVDACQT